MWSSDQHAKKYLEQRSKLSGNGCIEWTNSTDVDGYGYAQLRSQSWRAHRLSYSVHYNVSREDMASLQVCHRCDNPKCINPEHLFLGTAYDNRHDMIDKGRDKRGSNHSNAKLPNEEVSEIREKYSKILLGRTRGSKTGLTYEDVAKIYGISQRALYLIVHNKTYKDV